MRRRDGTHEGWRTQTGANAPSCHWAGILASTFTTSSLRSSSLLRTKLTAAYPSIVHTPSPATRMIGALLFHIIRNVRRVFMLVRDLGRITSALDHTPPYTV